MDDPRSPARSDARPDAPHPWMAVGPRDAPLIVFLHGTRLTRALWLPQLRRLGGRYRCVAVDLPGHGLRAGEPFTLEAAVAAVSVAVETESSSGKAVLVGLSLGGYVAIEAAEARPDLVSGLVLAGCSAEAFGPLAWPFRLFATFMERVPTPVTDRLNGLYFRIRYPRGIADPIVEGGFWPAAGAQAVRLLVGRRYLERLGRLWLPVLVVNGTLDPVFGPQGDHWAASCRSGRHAPIRRAMHLSNLDRPTTFARLVAAFTERAARGG